MPFTDCMQWHYQGLTFYAWSVLIPSNTNIFRKLLPDHADFFRAHIKLKETYSEFVDTRIRLPNFINFSDFL